MSNYQGLPGGPTPFEQLAMEALEEDRKGETTPIETLEEAAVDPTAADFGALLRAKRNEQGLSTEALARATGLSQTYILQIEKGNRPPPEEAIVKRLSMALGLDPAVEAAWVLAAGWWRVPDAWKRELQRLRRYVIEEGRPWQRS